MSPPAVNGRFQASDVERPSGPSSHPADDPENRLPAIDRLEGFHPDGPCLYRRVLVPVRAKGAEFPARLYVADVTEYLGFKPLPSGKWRS